MGCQKDVAEDLVQSMYLRLHRLVTDGKKIMYNDEEVNRFYVYITLRNMFLDYKKAKNKYVFFEYIETDSVEPDNDDYLLHEEANLEEQLAFSFLTEEIIKEIRTWNRYDSILAHLYLKTDYSMRDIASGSGISLTSIFNSVKNYKRILKEKFGEHWEDYINGDWHLLKEETNG